MHGESLKKGVWGHPSKAIGCDTLNDNREKKKKKKFIGFTHNVGKTFAVLLNKNKNNFHNLKLIGKLSRFY